MFACRNYNIIWWFNMIIRAIIIINIIIIITYLSDNHISIINIINIISMIIR